MDKKQTHIDELLTYKKRDYDIFEQKSELLFRNKTFLQDYAKLDTFFNYGRRLQQIFNAFMKEKGSKGPSLFVEHHLHRSFSEAVLAELGLKKVPNEPKWFYEKWEIRDSWNGEKDSLGASPRPIIQAGPVLCAISPKKEDMIPFSYWYISGKKRISCKPLYQPKIFIAVDPWTTSAKIGQLCRLLPVVKEEIFGFKEEPKSDFARFLCWYDLKIMGLTFMAIAEAWSRKRQPEFRSLVEKSSVDQGQSDRFENYATYNLPQVVRSAVVRLQRAIDHLSR